MGLAASLESARGALREAGLERDGVCSYVFRQLCRCVSADFALGLATALLERGENGLAKIVVARALIDNAGDESLSLMALRFEVECRALAA